MQNIVAFGSAILEKNIF